MLLSIVLIINFISFDKAEEGIQTYRSYANHSNLIGNLQTHMLLVRMNVNDYITNQDEQSANNYKKYFKNMEQELEESKRAINDPQQSPILAKMEQSLNTYRDSFAEVSGLIQQKNQIHQEKLIPLGSELIKNINSMIGLTEKAHENKTSFYMSKMKESLLLGQIQFGQFLIFNNEETYRSTLSLIGDSWHQRLVKLKDLLSNQEQLDAFEVLDKHYDDYIQSVSKVHDLILNQNNIINQKIYKIGPEVGTQVHEIKLDIIKNQDELGPKLVSSINNSLHLVAILSVLAIAIGISAAYFITITITKPIHRAVSAANQLAEGDLTVTIDKTSSDETGQLLTAIQNTAVNLKQMMSTINQASIELASASEELAVVTDQSSQGIIRQESETDMVATAMNQMTVTVHDIANNAAQAADAASQADTQAQSSSNILEQAISSINTLSESVHTSSSRLDEVEAEVANINTILDVIKGIADQTNLLALNAAIEAARAGEQGRGFAVVADEVRSLASRTQNSTQEIQTIIEQLHAKTRNTVQVMERGTQQAEESVQNANDTNQALQEIIQAITVINDMNMQIASASEQQSSVAETININIENVKTIAEENALTSTQTKTSSTEIAKLAEQLNQLVSQFKVQ